MLSVILVSYNTKDILRKALKKVYNQKDFDDFEVIVVDNNSKDDSCAMVSKEFPQVKLIRHKSNSGFASGNNLGIREATGEYILLLNSDAYVFDDTFKETVKYIENNPKTGIMGVQLICENGDLQPSAQPFPNPWRKFKVLTGYEARHPSNELYYNFYKSKLNEVPEPRNVDWVPGTYFLIRREVINEIGLLDDNFFMYFEEVDYCKRTINAGWDVVFNPNIIVIHLGGASSQTTKKEVSRKGRQLVDIRVNSEYYYYLKHHGRFIMYLAGFVEIGWKGLICIKNRLFKGEFALVKYSEAKLAVNLVWQRMLKSL